jgi:uncharacterized protein (DUF885 family)
MYKYSVVIVLVVVSSCNMGPKTKTYTADEIAAESKKVNDYLDRKFDEQVARYPETAATLGLKINYDSWNDRSDEAGDRELVIFKATVDTLKQSFNLNALDAQTALSVRMMEEDLKRFEEGIKWRHYDYEVNQMEGIQNGTPDFLINVHKIDTLSDAEAYLSRLKKIDKVFDQTIENLKKSEAIGVIPPYFTFKKVSDDVKTFIANCEKKDNNNVLLDDFTTKVNKLKIEKADKDKLIAEATDIIKTTVKSSYQRLLDYWAILEPKAKEKGSNGAWSLPKGEAFYAYCLKEHTTTDMTPDEVFKKGESEVAIIKEQMHAIMKQVNFKNDSLQDFFKFVRTDAQFKYSNDEKGHKELLADAHNYIDSMRAMLPKLFITMPKAPLVVKEVEKFREKTAGGAFYEQPSEDGSRPGRYYVNNYDMNDEPKYQMEALTYHEAIPGHHMQITIAQEMKSLPRFRRFESFTAYIEGWGLYAERLGKDVGKYQDPYSDFGRLSMEIFRAARLVVDVGIHTKHWTRGQAIDYFMKNTANAEGDAKNEIERYFLWPGQATAYKIGMLKILELREKAKKELGDKFDIREFHEVVLSNGAVSLTVLEELVNNWIAGKKKEMGKA